MSRFLRCVVLALVCSPLAHGCHREDDEILNRWLVIYATVAGLTGVLLAPDRRLKQPQEAGPNVSALPFVPTAAVVPTTPLKCSK